MPNIIFDDVYKLIEITAFITCTFILFRIYRKGDRIFKPTESNFSKHLNQVRKATKREFYQELVAEHQPFNWRIALALYKSGLSFDDRKKVVDALQQVLKIEHEAVKKFDVNKSSSVENLVRPFSYKGNLSQIEALITSYNSHMLIEDSSEDESLEFLVSLEVDSFAKEFAKKQEEKFSDPPF